MKTDIERICEVAREGGCECWPCHYDIEFAETTPDGKCELVEASSAVYMPRMIKALTHVLCRYTGYIPNWCQLDTEKDRIAWVIENIIERIERAKTESTINSEGRK